MKFSPRVWNHLKNSVMGLSLLVNCYLLLLDGGWTTRSPADGNKSLSLPKSICSQEVVSSCLGKDLSAWRRSPISGTDYSGRDHITIEDCFWIARLVMKHGFSVSELQTVCSVHVANFPIRVRNTQLLLYPMSLIPNVAYTQL